MSGLAARAEAHENHNTLPNAVLDMIEAAVRTAIDNDLEAPLRARLKRLLPDPEPKTDLFAASPPATDLPPMSDLDLQVLSTQAARFGKLKSFTGGQHETVRTIKASADAILAHRKQARKAQ